MKEEVADRIDTLCASPTLYLEKFGKLRKWTGPSAYFHAKTLDRLESLRSPLVAVHDRHFQEYLYATLCAWGLHRMGDEDGRLVEFDKFCQGLEELEPELGQLQRLRLEELAPQEVVSAANSLWRLMERMRFRPVDKPSVVVASKALHHLLPDLVVPIDDKHTTVFFSWKNTWRNKPREMFLEIFPLLADIAKRIKPQVGAYIGQPFHKSLPKVIDNAIVGFISPGSDTILGESPIAEDSGVSGSSNTSFGGPPKATDADRIRQKALELYFVVARRQGRREVVITSGDLHRQVGLHNRYRNVCQALAGTKLLRTARAELLKQEGPKDSSTTRFTYRLL